MTFLLGLSHRLLIILRKCVYLFFPAKSCETKGHLFFTVIESTCAPVCSLLPRILHPTVTCRGEVDGTWGSGASATSSAGVALQFPTCVTYQSRPQPEKAITGPQPLSFCSLLVPHFLNSQHLLYSPASLRPPTGLLPSRPPRSDRHPPPHPSAPSKTKITKTERVGAAVSSSLANCSD